MDGYRSQSCRDGREMQVERDLQGERDSASELGRSYSTGGYNNNNVMMMMGKEMEMKKAKSRQQGLSKSWSLNDPELKRKKRVAGYKVYAVEGKVKGSVKKSFRWIKDLVYGWR